MSISMTNVERNTDLYTFIGGVPLKPDLIDNRHLKKVKSPNFKKVLLHKNNILKKYLS